MRGSACFCEPLRTRVPQQSQAGAVWRTAFDVELRLTVFPDFDGALSLAATGRSPPRCSASDVALRRPGLLFFSWRLPPTAILSICDAVGIIRTSPTSASVAEADGFSDVMLLTGVLY